MSVSKKPKKECCGCSVCAAVCPKHCITIKPDGKGFDYPEVDASLCIECGACEHVCPFPGTTDDVARPHKALAAWAVKPSDQKASSSGGLATIAARDTLSRGGIVYGCTSDRLDVCHCRIDSADQLDRLRGSKYVQSRLDEAMPQLRDDLRNGRQVLFIGSPCQAAAARRLAGKHHDRLLTTIDIICHGVPSRRMLADHLRPSLNGITPDRIIFRDGNNYCLHAIKQHNAIYRASLNGDDQYDLYCDAFFSAITSRPSCYNCSYAQPRRTGDLTLGDFWGLKNAEQLSDRTADGVSAILVNNDRGAALVERLSPAIEAFERPVEEAINGNAQLRRPTKRRMSARLFSTLYPLLPFDMAVKLSLIPRKFNSLLRIIRNGCHR